MHISFYIRSSSEDNPCRLIMGYNREYKVIPLPNILKPIIVKRMNYYSKKEYNAVVSRQYGILYDCNMIILYYGRDAGESGDQKISYTIPWLNYTFMKTEYLNTDGTIFKICNGYAELSEEDVQPSLTIMINDYDGEDNLVTLTRQKRYWHRGTKSWKWLRHITPPLIRETVGIIFDKELGTGKNSYKGGILGTSIDMLAGETMLDTFLRFAKKHNLTL